MVLNWYHWAKNDLSPTYAHTLDSEPRSDTGSRWWVPAYAALGSIGFLAGAWTYNALS